MIPLHYSRTRQPDQVVPLSKTNKFAKRLAGFFVVYDGFVYDHVSGKRFTSTSGTFKRNKKGYCWQSGGSGHIIDCGDLGWTYPSADAYKKLTTVSGGVFSNAGSHKIILSHHSSGASLGWALKTEQSTTNNIGFTHNGATGGDVNSGVALNTGAYTTIGCSVNGSTGHTFIQTYGRTVQKTGYVSPSILFKGGTPSKVTIGAGYNGSVYVDFLNSGDQINFIAVFIDDVLLGAEQLDFTLNPWQVLAEEVLWLPVVAAGGGGGVSIPIVMHNRLMQGMR